MKKWTVRTYKSLSIEPLTTFSSKWVVCISTLRVWDGRLTICTTRNKSFLLMLLKEQMMNRQEICSPDLKCSWLRKCWRIGTECGHPSADQRICSFIPSEKRDGTKQLTKGQIQWMSRATKSKTQLEEILYQTNWETALKCPRKKQVLSI